MMHLTDHLTDEEMMEQAYGESENTAAVERHLAACRPCAGAFAELQRDLAALDRPEAPARDSGYGQRVWASLAPRLPAYRSEKQRRWTPGFTRGLAYAAVCTVLLACAFYAGRLWEQKKQPPVAQVAPKSPAPRQPIVVVVLDDHLDRSERFLVELKHADMDSSAMVSPLRDEARSLLAANRVARKDAAQQDDPELTTALGHLDSLLAEAANEPGGLNAASIAKLQDEMNADGVLFEVRVLRSRIARQGGAATTPSKGGTI